MNLQEIIKATENLYDYERKQLAIVLISQTLSTLSVDETISFIEPNPKPYDIKINWADGTTTYKDKKGATITDKQSLNDALKFTVDKCEQSKAVNKCEQSKGFGEYLKQGGRDWD